MENVLKKAPSFVVNVIYLYFNGVTSTEEIAKRLHTNDYERIDALIKQLH